jgi:uncharacterized protein
VNVWIALGNPQSPFHRRAVSYWREEAAAEIAFCRFTMLGFLRLATNPVVMGRVTSVMEAWRFYQEFRSQSGVVFVDEQPGLDFYFSQWANRADSPARLWSDAYLAAFAGAGGHRIVSFDSDFKRFTGIDFLHLTP